MRSFRVVISAGAGGTRSLITPFMAFVNKIHPPRVTV